MAFNGLSVKAKTRLPWGPGFGVTSVTAALKPVPEAVPASMTPVFI
jgi:hypothetical protein